MLSGYCRIAFFYCNLLMYVLLKATSAASSSFIYETMESELGPALLNLAE